GKDIIFSYGPLSFLSTRTGYGISRWYMLLFDIFIIINFFFVFKDFIQRAYDKFIAVVFLLAIFILVRIFFGSDTAWVLLSFSIFWMYKFFKSPSLLSAIMQALLITITFYCKLNTGIVILFFFAAHLANMIYFKKVTRKMVVI